MRRNVGPTNELQSRRGVEGLLAREVFVVLISVERIIVY